MTQKRVGKSHSIELRQKAMLLLSEGITSEKVAKMLGLGGATVRNWRVLDMLDKLEGFKPIKIDLKELEKILINGQWTSKTCEILAKKFNCTPSAIYLAKKRLLKNKTQFPQ